jgi:hypothetical protein
MSLVPSVLDPDHPLTALRYLKSICPDEDLSTRSLAGFFDTSGVPHDGISCAPVSAPSRQIDLHTYVALTDGRNCDCGFYRGTPQGQALAAVSSMCNVIRLSSLSVSLSVWPEIYRLLTIISEAPNVLRAHASSSWVNRFLDVFSESSDSLLDKSLSSVSSAPLMSALAAHGKSFQVSFGNSQDFSSWSQLLVSSLFEIKDLDSMSRRYDLYKDFEAWASIKSGLTSSVVFSTRRLRGPGIKRRPGGILLLLSATLNAAVSGDVVSAEMPEEVVAGLDALFSNENFYCKTSSPLSENQLQLASQLWSDSPSDELYSLAAVVRVVEGLS